MSEAQATETTENTENPTIQLVDLANALRIIDVAAKRGAFEGAELSQVGAVRDKIAAFLNAVTPAEEPAAEQTEEHKGKKKK